MFYYKKYCVIFDQHNNNRALYSNYSTAFATRSAPFRFGRMGSESAQDYYPFGMLMPSRTSNSDKYRFGFNGKENDNEVKGTGDQQDYGMRIYDTRLCRFLSIDPITKKYPELTPYQFASNTPIRAIDLDGEEAYYSTNGHFMYWGKIKGDKAPVIVVTDKIIKNKVLRVELTLKTKRGEVVNHGTFKEIAAFAFNETYPNNEIDRYRVANTIANMDNSPGFQKTDLMELINSLRGTRNDSHEKRLKNQSDLAKTGTKSYANYFLNQDGTERTEEERNQNKVMMQSNAAVINAFRNDDKSIDYTEGIDGTIARQWRGANKDSGNNDRYFEDIDPVTQYGKNQIKEFKHEQVAK